MKKIISFILVVSIIFCNTSIYASNETLFMKEQTCYQTDEEQKYVTEKVAQIIDELSLKKRNLYTRIAMIDEWISNNVKYDYEKVEEVINSRRTAYSALKNGYTVCVGYSQLAMEFCRQLGISCEYIGCISKKSQKRHSMLLVEVGISEDARQWYYWDVTNHSNFLLGEQSISEDYEIIKKKHYYDINNYQIAYYDYTNTYKPTYFLTKQDLKASNDFLNIIRNYGKKISKYIYVNYNNNSFYTIKRYQNGRYAYDIYEIDKNDPTKLKYTKIVFVYDFADYKIIK